MMNLRSHKISLKAALLTTTALVSISSVIFPVSAFAQSQNLNTDLGYQNRPRLWGDVNQDGKQDFCRFVGSRKEEFLSCHLAQGNGFSSNKYGFNSIKGIDRGYDNLPQWMQDVNRDGRDDFCRFVGNGGEIKPVCNLARKSGFDTNQYTLDISSRVRIP
ncbi:hypothetical protein Riv7116_5167 [Rivularia sp. PCC 7116]|uniref:hypothetical protein n=1 Tax=Rivularia sp. PCC 7116 TaxID=373994 RepID=UPI00029ECA71|nr:hypothetical protein [Rivularia sp. PCC 7116]AFY57563.1 hypothetical protein Riv7116_5167 [Rivularia sp. PCC 7116]